MKKFDFSDFHKFADSSDSANFSAPKTRNSRNLQNSRKIAKSRKSKTLRNSRNLQKIFCAILIFALIISGNFAVAEVFAQPEQNIISANCQNSQTILSRVEKSDAVVRINRGREYNDALNLLFSMNARLAANKINAPRLAEITSEFDKNVNLFRENYDAYDDDIANSINFDCAKNPTEFYTLLETARNSRKNLAENVKYLNELLNNYRDEFNNLTEAKE